MNFCAVSELPSDHTHNPTDHRAQRQRHRSDLPVRDQLLAEIIPAVCQVVQRANDQQHRQHTDQRGLNRSTAERKHHATALLFRQLIESAW